MDSSKSLTVAVYESQIEFNLTYSEDGGYVLSGFHGKVLKNLLDYLRLQVTFVSLSDFPQYHYIEHMVDDGLADLAVACTLNYEMDSEKPFIGEYSIPYHRIQTTFALKKSASNVSEFSFLKAFTISTWLGFLGVCLFFPILYAYFSGVKMSATDIWFQLQSCVLRQTFNFQVRSARSRILTAVWLIFVLIFSYSFSGVMYSIMIDSSKNPSVRNFDELYESVHEGKLKAYAPYSMPLLMELAHSKNENVKSLLKTIIHGYKFLQFNQMNLSGVFDAGNAVVMDEFRLSLLIGRDPEIYISEDKIFPKMVAIYMKKKFRYKKKVNKFIRRQSEAGIFQKMFDEELIISELRQPKTKPQDVIRPFTLKDFSGVFYILIFGLIVSFIVFILEKIVAKYQLKLSNKSNRSNAMVLQDRFKPKKKTSKKKKAIK